MHFDSTASLWQRIQSLAPGDEARRAVLARFVVSSLTVWSSSFVNGLQLSYHSSSSTEPSSAEGAQVETWEAPLILGHNDDPSPRRLSLAPGERISSFFVRAGAIVDSVRVVTSFGQDVRFGDSTGGTEIALEVPVGWRVVGFSGGRGGHIHNVSVILSREETE